MVLNTLIYVPHLDVVKINLVYIIKYGNNRFMYVSYILYITVVVSHQWRIQDFPAGGATSDEGAFR